MICSFPPICGENPKILILGSMPGVASLTRQEYYAHAQNAFWKIMFSLLSDLPVPDDFESRKKLMLENHIAVWDVLESCEREGSLDSKIRNGIANPIPQFLDENPLIKAIFFNGKESQKIFVKTFGSTISLPQFSMPSTSPAYTIKFESKLEVWKSILDYL